MEGWITLNRSLLDHYIWQDEPFTRGQAWVDLLLLVTHEPKQALIDGELVELKVGEYVTTIRRLSERWGRSIDWVTKFLNLLRSDNMIQTRVVGKGKNSRTILLLVNYEVYQYSANANRSNSDQLAITKRTHKGGKGVISNNINNILNNKETREQYISPCSPPKGEKKQTAYEAEFNEIWSAYPKREGKQNALKDYEKARADGVSMETIKAGVDAYNNYIRATGREKKYIKAGSTWFHQHCWEDDYSTESANVSILPDDFEERYEQMKREGLL